MTRLPILESTAKQLYGTASTCAHPACDEPLLRWVDGLDTPILNSRIAHICAASALGPRYDEAMTDEDRRVFDNLVLLCLPHAEEVDLTALAERYPVETLHQWKVVQLQSAPPKPPNLPEGLLERAVVLSMGDVLMDFREATIPSAASPPQHPVRVAPEVEPSGRVPGEETEAPAAATTSSPSPARRSWARFQSRLAHAGRGGWMAYPAKPEGIHALAPSSHPAAAAKRTRFSLRLSRRSSRPLSLQPCLPTTSRSTTVSATSVVPGGLHTTSQNFPVPSAPRFASGLTCPGPTPSLGQKFPSK